MKYARILVLIPLMAMLSGCGLSKEARRELIDTVGAGVENRMREQLSRLTDDATEAMLVKIRTAGLDEDATAKVKTLIESELGGLEDRLVVKSRETVEDFLDDKLPEGSEDGGKTTDVIGKILIGAMGLLGGARKRGGLL